MAAMARVAEANVIAVAASSRAREKEGWAAWQGCTQWAEWVKRIEIDLKTPKALQSRLTSESSCPRPFYPSAGVRSGNLMGKR